jgi:hypothetical protein
MKNNKAGRTEEKVRKENQVLLLLPWVGPVPTPQFYALVLFPGELIFLWESLLGG